MGPAPRGGRGHDAGPQGLAESGSRGAIRVELFRAGVFGPNWAQVVGVIEPVRMQSLVSVEREQIYLAHHQAPQRTMYPAIKTAGHPMAVLPAVQAAVHSLEKDLPVFDVRLATDYVSLAMARTRFAMIGLGIFALAALALAAAGVYAAMAFTVALRRREIGIRLAIGGAPRSIAQLVLRQGLAWTSAGVLAGLIGALALTRLLSGLLHGVTSTDPATLVVVATVLVTVGAAACWLPAWRAARIDPVETLRTD
jgi:putative ABC transport system permease protein